MANRYSDTLKWQDEWFVELSAIQKLLFIYLCDNCDIAGFIELSYRKFAFDLNLKDSEIKGAFKGLEKSVISSNDQRVILVKNFIRHQKNIPINSQNKAHIGILKRIDIHIDKFDNIEFDEENGFNLIGAIKPLGRGTGIGNGIGIIDSKVDISTREKIFKESLYQFTKYDKNPEGLYSPSMVKDFFNYWSEKNKSQKQMRFELQKTWDSGRRLATWSRNNFNGDIFTNSKGESSDMIYTPVNNKIDHSNRV